MNHCHRNKFHKHLHVPLYSMLTQSHIRRKQKKNPNKKSHSRKWSLQQGTSIQYKQHINIIHHDHHHLPSIHTIIHSFIHLFIHSFIQLFIKLEISIWEPQLYVRVYLGKQKTKTNTNTFKYYVLFIYFGCGKRRRGVGEGAAEGAKCKYFHNNLFEFLLFL